MDRIHRMYRVPSVARLVEVYSPCTQTHSSVPTSGVCEHGYRLWYRRATEGTRYILFITILSILSILSILLINQ